MSGLPAEDAPLLTLLQRLEATGYHFITPTPESHKRVLNRPREPRPIDLRDVFGWSRPFREGDIPGEFIDLLEGAGELAREDGVLKSRLRVSSEGGRLFLHSAYPTNAEDSVFFGPDTYRFATFIRRELGDGGGTIVDIGAGSGLGGIVAATLRPTAKLILADINPKALRLARINAAAAGVSAQTVCSDGLKGVEGPLDVVLANPPYVATSTGRAYRDGGDMLGAELSFDWAEQAVARLSPGGKLLLYTGSAIVRGEDHFEAALRSMVAEAGCDLRYEEIDPDVFGEMLSEPAYREADRIAAIGAVITKRSA